MTRRHKQYRWPYWLAALLLGALALPAAPAHAAGAARQRMPPVVVLTGTTFPGGLGLGVAADPLGLGPAALPGLRGLGGGLRARIQPSLAVEHLELNQATPALRDPRVRQALQAALDKRALAGALFPASIQPDRLVATSLTPTASPYHDASLRPSRFDPAEARRLLKAAGYATTLHYTGRGGA